MDGPLPVLAYKNGNMLSEAHHLLSEDNRKNKSRREQLHLPGF